MDEPLTKSLERYDVLDRIAVGGMAEVFLAKAYGAHGFEKTLAIKRILPELARDPEFEARFIAEAKVAVRLSHANVVQVLDFGRIGESLFIAMEYVDGLDLAAMLRKFKDEKRQVPLPAAFHIAIEIVRALDFAHSHNVVHRDVSPSNVLVSRAGEVKLADFGIAVAARPHRGGGPGPRKVMGKWRYMSPEQARGDTLDTRSDMFSAASVIFELFTGEKLFPGDEAEEIIKNIEGMPIPRMSALRPGLPSRLDDVIAGPLARKPIDRPTRPAAVLRSLIELSYESSIMATALDVAEALATVIPAKRISGRGALDDVIRKQLHEQSVARRTAVTDGKPPSTETLERGEVSTGLFRKIDIDGLSRLEEVDATKVAAPRAKRATGQPEADIAPSDSADLLGALYDANRDPDRVTQVGGPPTGQVPKLGESAIAMKAVKLAPAPPSRRGLIMGLVVATLAAGAFGVWAFTRSPGAKTIEDAAAILQSDGPPPETKSALIVESIPAGATVWIDNVEVDRGQQARVPSGTTVHIKLVLKGYRTLEFDYPVAPGRNTLSRTLEVAPATIHLESAPTGATLTASVGGITCTTPCEVTANAARNVEFTLTKPGFDALRWRSDLEAGDVYTWKKELKESPKFGYVQIKLTGSAKIASMSEGGRTYGDTATGMGPVSFQLPVGHHVLTLKKKVGSGTTTVAVEIVEGKTSIVSAKLE
jgi:serine/threonine protein kinase